MNFFITLVKTLKTEMWHHVSEPYKSTDFTFVLKILSFVLNLTP